MLARIGIEDLKTATGDPQQHPSSRCVLAAHRSGSVARLLDAGRPRSTPLTFSA